MNKINLQLKIRIKYNNNNNSKKLFNNKYNLKNKKFLLNNNKYVKKVLNHILYHNYLILVVLVLQNYNFNNQKLDALNNNNILKKNRISKFYQNKQTKQHKIQV